MSAFRRRRAGRAEGSDCGGALGSRASCLVVYGLLGLSGTVFYLESLREKGAQELLQGHRRRQSMEYDQFPTTPEPWVCDVLSRSHRQASLALFLESMACGWDGSHYTFIGSHGYRPHGLVYEAVFSDPGPLGLHLNVSRHDHVRVDAFLVSGGRLLQGQAGRCVHLGDHLLAINGRPLQPSDMTDEALRSLFRQAGSSRPTTLTLLSDPHHELVLKETAFSPLLPLLLLRPLLRLTARLPTPLQHLCLLLFSALLSSLGLALGRRTRSSIYPSSSSSLLSDALLLCMPAAFCLCLPYSEPVYFLLSSALLLCLTRGHLLPAAALSLLLPLCRPLGIFAALPLLCYSYRAASEQPSRHPALLLLLPLSPLVGVALHLGLQAKLTGGSAWSPVTSQSSFIATFSLSKLLLPTHLLPELLFGRTGAGVWHAPRHDPLDSPIDRLLFLTALLLLLLTWCRLPPYVWAFSLAHLLVPPLAGSFMSYSRFSVLGAFPLLWALEASERAGRPSGEVVVEGGKAEGVAVAGQIEEGKRQAYRPIMVPSSLAWLMAGAGMAVQVEFMRRFMTSQWAF